MSRHAYFINRRDMRFVDAAFRDGGVTGQNRRAADDYWNGGLNTWATAPTVTAAGMPEWEAALASSTLGGLMAVWSAAGLLNTPREVKLGPLPGVLGAGVPMVLGALAALSGYRSVRGVWQAA